MPKVVLVNEKKELEVPQGANLREEVRKAGLDVHGNIEYLYADRVFNCMGHGLCGTCRVLVKKGMENLNKRTTLERINLKLHPLSMLSAIGREDEIRLACQIQVNGDCTIETHPGLNWSGENFWQKPYPNK
jgi:ferredoxin